MSDSAKGPAAGYLFQFEIALLLLARLENKDDYISIEDVDDVAKHKEDGTVLLTVQAKHSISNSGSTFQDTSKALWRTLEIWIKKLEEGVFEDEVKFICTSNKLIPKSSLIYRIQENPYDDVIQEIEELLESQKKKLKEIKKTDKKKGGAITNTIKLISFVLKKKPLFERIKNNLIIKSQENLKDKFLTALNLSSDSWTEVRKGLIHNTYSGWIVNYSMAKWRNSDEARITKETFDDQWFEIFSNSSIVNAVFRTKDMLGEIDDDKIKKGRKELFVKQIEDIQRNSEAKKRIINAAILDFLRYDIELAHIVSKGNYFKPDFEEFSEQCFEIWRDSFDRHVLKDIKEYEEEEINALAISLYDDIMSNMEIMFKGSFAFDVNTKYIKNGSFLHMSNVPLLGWRADWEEKYK